MSKESPTKNVDHRIDTAVKVIAFFFACILSFSLGIYVGKRFSDYQHKLAQLELEPHNSSQNLVSKSSSLISDDDLLSNSIEKELTQEEIEKLAQQMASNDVEKIDLPDLQRTIASTKDHTKTTQDHIPATKDHDSSTKDHPNSKNNKSQEISSNSEEQPSMTKTVSSSKPLSKEPQTASHSTLNKEEAIHETVQNIQKNYKTKFTVQVGAFPTQEEAQKLINEINKKGANAFSIKVNLPDPRNAEELKTWYRVNIGLYGSFKEAESAKNEMIANKTITYGFVQKISD